jgi:hypothetical protein
MTESILYAFLTILNMSWDNEIWTRMIRESMEMASNQVKRNVEMAFEMASNQVKRNVEMAFEMARALTMSSGTLGKETNAAIENASKEMMASAEKARSEMMASAEKARSEMLKEMMDSIEKMKMSFSPSNTKRK